MTLPDIRQRAGLLFLAVAVGHIVLISAQVNSRTGIPLLQAAVFGAFSQVQRGAAAVLGAGQAVWNNYVDLRRVRADNAALRQQLTNAQIQLQQQQSQLQATARLQQLLELRANAGVPMTGAVVIGSSSVPTTGAVVIAGSPAPDSRTVTVDKGRRDKVQVDMAVLATGGVVGRIMTVSRRTADVQLLIDRNAALAGTDERSRAQGIVFGNGDDLLRMDYLSATADVRPGDTVVSSGIEGVYPAGFRIGRVERVDRSGTTVKGVWLRPSVDFGALENVLVVLQGPRLKGGEGKQ